MPYIRGTRGDDIIIGTDQPDYIDADGDANEVGGDDIVRSGIGPDAVYGGLGADLLDGGSGSDLLYGDDGDDALIGGVGDDMLDGGRGLDTMHGGYGNDRLVSRQYQELSPEVLDGGPGFDRAEIYVSAGEEPLNLSFADLTIDHEVFGTVLHSIEKLTLYAGSGADHITGGAYDDQIYGGGGDNAIDGGPGNDTVSGGFGRNTLTGGDGDDFVVGAGADRMYGGAGNDELIRSRNSDEETDGPICMDGGSGDDGIYLFNGPSAGGTLIDGGEGIDGAIIMGFDDLTPVTFELGDPSQDSVAGTLTVRGIERIDFIGSNGEDVVSGGDLNDTIFGEIFPGGGDDTLSGRGGDDYIFGADGDDVLSGGSGKDQILGGSGKDRISGGAGDDVLTLTDGADTVFGGAGDDIITGGGGRVSYGNDADRLYGGAGADIFVYEGRNGSRKGSELRDVIKDFAVGEDKIDLSALPGDYAVVDHFTRTAGQIVLKSLASGYTAINIDTDADLKADMQIYAFTGGAAMTSADFIL